jgi:hypothetical protein
MIASWVERVFAGREIVLVSGGEAVREWCLEGGGEVARRADKGKEREWGNLKEDGTHGLGHSSSGVELEYKDGGWPEIGRWIDGREK